MKLYYFYSPKGEYVESVWGTSAENAISRYPLYKKDMLISEFKLNNPIIKNGKIVEKSRVDLILEGNLDLLIDGEYVEGGEIITVEAPQGLLSPKWNVEKKEWIEGATLKEIMTFFNNSLENYISQKLASYGYEDVSRLDFWLDDDIFGKECKMLKEWIKSVWKTAREIQSQFMQGLESGEGKLPTLEDIIKMLPEMKDGKMI